MTKFQTYHSCMTDLGKLLMVLGGGLLLVGLAVWALGHTGFRGLPGDIRYHGQHVRFYFPIVSCLVLSALLTAALWLFQWLSRK